MPTTKSDNYGAGNRAFKCPVRLSSLAVSPLSKSSRFLRVDLKRCTGNSTQQALTERC
jgi:hypothetical protein